MDRIGEAYERPTVLMFGIAYPAGVPGRLLAVGKQGGLAVVLSSNIPDEPQCVLLKFARRRGLGAVLARTSLTT
jgi:uncharacterized protein